MHISVHFLIHLNMWYFENKNVTPRPVAPASPVVPQPVNPVAPIVPQPITPVVPVAPIAPFQPVKPLPAWENPMPRKFMVANQSTAPLTDEELNAAIERAMADVLPY
jgi:hypothetical protein